MDGFMNDTRSSFQNLRQEKIQGETDAQSKVMEVIIDADGGHTTWRAAKKEGIIFMRFLSQVWYERLLYYGEIDDKFCLCKLSASQKQTFSFYDW